MLKWYYYPVNPLCTMAAQGMLTSLTRVLTQGQKDNVLPYVRPELLNTIGHYDCIEVPQQSASACAAWAGGHFDLLGGRQPTKSCLSKSRQKSVSAWVCHTQTTVAHLSFAYIFVNYASILGQHQYTLLPNMSKKSAALED